MKLGMGTYNDNGAARPATIVTESNGVYSIHVHKIVAGAAVIEVRTSVQEGMDDGQFMPKMTWDE